MECKNCGAILPDDSGARFCRHCGAELVPNVPTPASRTAIDDTRSKLLVNEMPDTKSVLYNNNGVGLVVGIALGVIAVVGVVLFLFLGPHIATNSGSPTGANDPADPESYVSANDSTNDEGQEGVPAKSNQDDHLSADSISIANLVNGGHMASAGNGKLYYAEPIDGTDWDTRSIVESSLDGSNKRTLYIAPATTVNVYHLNPVDDKLVFTQVIENQSTVVCLDVVNKDYYTIDTCDDWALCQVVEDTVYYLKRGRLYASDVEGKHKNALAVVGENAKWRVFNNKLYTFASEQAEAVYATDLDGSNAETIYEESDGYKVKVAFPVAIDDNTVALAVLEGADGKDDLVRLVNSSGSVRTIASADSIMRINASENGLVLTKQLSDDHYAFEVVAYSGVNASVEAVVPYAGEVRYTTCIDGAEVFAAVNGDDCSVHSFDFDSRAFSTIAD